MHFTLHLTNQCNIRCRYCYVDKARSVMDEATLNKAVAMAADMADGQPVGLTFFGGEPLLCKDMIIKGVEACHRAETERGVRFYPRMVTNGLLLDDAFLDFADRERLYIALSIDGIAQAHDTFRVDASGQGTHAAVLDAAKRLLKHQRYAPAMMVVNPETADVYAQGVDELFRLGFRYIISTINYAANWNGAALRKLGHAYRELSEWYYQHTVKEDKFYLAPFEVKIESHIKGADFCVDRCEMGLKQISVAPDGTLYPCVQFVGDTGFTIGHVDTGIDAERRNRLFIQNRTEQPECARCAIRDRCLHQCGCLNRQVTGSIDKVAPSLCAHERLLLPIADKLAARLYQKRNALFIQKHYNDLYPILSALEDADKLMDDNEVG